MRPDVLRQLSSARPTYTANAVLRYVLDSQQAAGAAYPEPHNRRPHRGKWRHHGSERPGI